jgi:hypothetical protein
MLSSAVTAEVIGSAAVQLLGVLGHCCATACTNGSKLSCMLLSIPVLYTRQQQQQRGSKHALLCAW